MIHDIHDSDELFSMATEPKETTPVSLDDG